MAATTAAAVVAVAWTTRRVRDLSVLPLPDGSHLVVACDSVGGIGPRPADTVAASAYTTGHFAARVPILELLATGASPHLIVNTLCFSSGPQADEMIRAIVDLAIEVGLDRRAVTGSTEDNVLTAVTGIGVTVIGSATATGLRTGSSRPGDLVVCLGLPRSAPQHELSVGDADMPTTREVLAALHIPGVREVLPVGSRGVACEMAELASTAGLRHRIHDRHRIRERHPRQGGGGLDVLASGGPASCVLVSLTSAALADLQSIRADLPVTVIGELC